MLQIVWSAIPWKRFGDLACRPFGRRMGRDVEVNGVTPLMGQHYEDKQQAKADCRHDQEINRHQLLGVVLQKSAPRLRRWPSLTHHVLGYCRLTDLYSQFQQFTVNPWRSPQGIRGSSGGSTLVLPS